MYTILRLLYSNTAIAFDESERKFWAYHPATALRRLCNLWLVIMMCGPDIHRALTHFQEKRGPMFVERFC